MYVIVIKINNTLLKCKITYITAIFKIEWSLWCYRLAACLKNVRCLRLGSRQLESMSGFGWTVVTTAGIGGIFWNKINLLT